ncbi:hypothetical protein [Candidatus Poriferisodalis sp.]
MILWDGDRGTGAGTDVDGIWVVERCLEGVDGFCSWLRSAERDGLRVKV